MLLATKSSEAIPFDASSDVNEPLIAAGDVNEPLIAASGAEEKDHRLEGKAVSHFKFSSVLLGLFVGFLSQFFALAVHFLLITVWGEDVVTKSKTRVVVLSLLCSLSFLVVTFAILGLFRNLVAITYSAIGGRSKDLHEEIVSYMECGFVLGALVGISLAWTMEAVLLSMRAQIVYSYVTVLVVAFFWFKIMMMRFATNIKPSSSRQSTAEQTSVCMMAV
jgi:hypothetical protein